jgi:hypothetical protein
MLPLRPSASENPRPPHPTFLEYYSTLLAGTGRARTAMQRFGNGPDIEAFPRDQRFAAESVNIARQHERCRTFF